MSIRIRFFIGSDDLLLPNIFDAISELESPKLVTKLVMEILILKSLMSAPVSVKASRQIKKSIQIELHITELTPCLTELHTELLELKFHSAQVLHIKKLLAEYSQPRGLPASPQIIKPSQEHSTPEIIAPTVNSSNTPPADPDALNALSMNIKSAKALFNSL